MIVSNRNASANRKERKVPGSEYGMPMRAPTNPVAHRQTKNDWSKSGKHRACLTVELSNVEHFPPAAIVQFDADRYTDGMDSVFDIVLPAFCLAGLGYAVARMGYLSETVGDGLADFVFKIAVPILLMKSIATAQFGQGDPWKFVVVYFLAIGVVWIAAVLMIRWMFKRGNRASVIAGLSAGYSNLALLGIPLVERAYGEQGLQILLFLLAFHLLVMTALSTFLMEYALRADGINGDAVQPMAIARTLGNNLLRNPIIVGIFIGLIWRLTGLGMSGAFGQVMDMLSRTTGPIALFSLGMGLIKFGIKGNVFAALCLAALSLIAMPAAVFIIGKTIVPLPTLWFKVALLAAACPTGINAYLLASYFKIAEGLASSTIVFALLGSIITIPLWLSLM
jgi:malonate transporter